MAVTLGALLFAGPLGGVFSFGTLVAASQTIIGVGLSVGLNLLSGALNRPRSPKPEDVQNILRQSVTVRTRHYGRVRVGGSLAFIETADGDLYQIIVHGQGPIDAYEQVFIDNRPVSLDGGGGVTTAPYNPTIQVIESYLGATSQTAIATIVSDFPTLWSSDHRLRGLACSMFKAGIVDQDEVMDIYPNRIPALNRVIRGALVYDPRDMSTAWSGNAALIMRDYLTHADGMQLPSSLIDDTMFGTAANVCDESVAVKAGGTIPRYAIGLSYNLDADPIDVITRIIAATDGRLFITSEGKVGFSVGKWATPTVTIDDAAGHIIDYEMSDGAGPFTLCNEVIVKYTHVEAGYKEVTCDPWRDETSIGDLGEVRSDSPELYEIQHHNHARRIAKIMQKRSAPRWQGTIVTTLHGLNAWDQRWINLKISDLEIDGTFEIAAPPAIDTQTMTMSFQVQSIDAGIYDFDAATEEGTAPANPDALTAAAIPAPTGVATSAVKVVLGTLTFEDSVFNPVTEENEIDEQEQDIEAYVARIVWNAPPRKGLTAEVQYSLDGSTWTGLSVGAETRRADTPPMQRGSMVWLRVRFRAVGAASSWVTGTAVSIPV